MSRQAARMQRTNGAPMKKVIYRTSYPNGKIYIYQPRPEGDYPLAGRREGRIIGGNGSSEAHPSFAILREVLWESDTASDEESNAKEIELILQHRSNDPAVGYNLWPTFGPAH